MSIPKFRDPSLIASGWFSDLHGPYGKVPVQFVGSLVSGEYVYFRARGEEVSLEVYPSEADFEADLNLIARYSEKVERHDDLGAGLMDNETCVGYIKEWVSTYLTHKRQAEEVSRQVESYIQ